MNGFGEFYWPDNKKYIGFYSDDKKEGFGFYLWEFPKKIFIGFWKGGKQHGVGKYLDESKEKYGLWRNGKKCQWFDNKEEIKQYIENEQQYYMGYFNYTFTEINEQLQRYCIYDDDIEQNSFCNN